MSAGKLHVALVIVGLGLLACEQKKSTAPTPSSTTSGALATTSGVGTKASGSAAAPASNPLAAGTIPLSEQQINDLLGTIDTVMDLPAESLIAPDAGADAGPASTSALEILRGTGNAAALPVVAANPGRDLDPTLRKRLTTITVNSERGDVTVGAISVEKGDRGRVLASLRGRYRNCYRTGLHKDPSLAGKLVMKVRVARNGEVVATEAESRTGLTDEVQICVLRVTKNAQFEPTEKDETFTVPLTFASPVANGIER
jgi:hypothetical protein